MADPAARRKQKGGGGMGGMKANQVTNDRVHPPDKKKFERETAEITRQIKDLEAKLKATQSDNTAQNIIAELSKLQAELGETERTRSANKTEVKKIEERLRSLGEEVMKKKNEASSLLAGMRCNSESKIDEIISKLRGVMLTRQLSDSDQRKYKHEIETLEKSKIQLREFTKAKDAAEKMRSEQDELRRRRDSCYCRSNELKEREVKIKDRMSELRAALDNAREKKREVSAQKDSISKDINVLYDRRRELHMSFREQQTAYQAAYQEERRLREEEERKRRENRQALKVEKFKRKLDQEMLRAIHYDEDIAIAKALISHLQANISGASSYLLGGEGESPSSSTTNLDVPEGAAAAGGVVSTRDSAVDQKPGEFVRKKDTEEVLVPARWTTVRRRSKREKRKSTVPKRLNFNPAIFHQFSHLGVQPPSSHAEISAVILKLQEKVAFFESKRNPAYSEAGDSGVGGMTDAEISQVQSVATSQEDLHLITVSPNTSVTDLKLPASYPLLHPQGPPSPSHPPQPQPTDNSGDLSDNESSRTVVEDDESSTPRSNSSLMALAIATASS